MEEEGCNPTNETVLFDKHRLASFLVGLCTVHLVDSVLWKFWGNLNHRLKLLLKCWRSVFSPLVSQKSFHPWKQMQKRKIEGKEFIRNVLPHTYYNPCQNMREKQAVQKRWSFWYLVRRIFAKINICFLCTMSTQPFSLLSFK